jgi:hypothetical protein
MARTSAVFVMDALLAHAFRQAVIAVAACAGLIAAAASHRVSATLPAEAAMWIACSAGAAQSPRGDEKPAITRMASHQMARESQKV